MKRVNRKPISAARRSEPDTRQAEEPSATRQPRQPPTAEKEDPHLGTPADAEAGHPFADLDEERADQRVPCDPTQMLVEWYEDGDRHIAGARQRKGKSRKRQLRYLQPAHVVAALVQNGLDAVMPKGRALTLLRLASLPHDDIRPARRTVAAMGGLSREVANEHLADLCRPWKPRGERHFYPPVFFRQQRPQTGAPRRLLTYYVPNERGWAALIQKVFLACKARKQEALDAMEITRRLKQGLARQARDAWAQQRRHGRR
jgi:hypothetical protein